MLCCLALGLIGFTPARHAPTVAELSELAKAKNVDALTAALDAPPARSPFSVLKTGGAYGVGRFGWSAVEMRDPEGPRRFVVFTTPLTSEDIGELLFEETKAGLHFIPEDHALGVRPIRHDFDIRFDIGSKQAFLRDRLTLESAKGGFGVFRMAPAYRVDSIDGKHDFSQAGGVVGLRLPKGRSTLNIIYHATVNLPDYAASISENEATLTNDYWYPMIARWPVPYDITVHAPKGWVAVCQGEETGKQEGANETVWHYRMDLPVVYYSITVSPFKPYTKKIDGRRFSVWSLTLPEDQEEMQCELYAPIIAAYDKWFGHFPFSGYGCVLSRSYGGGALEAYSFATYGVGMPGEDGHETSHTWWGGIICNTYLHSFWNESFADYTDAFYHRNVPIGNVAERNLMFIDRPRPNSAWDAAPIGSAGVDIGPVASALGYGKGAAVLEQLEAELGPAGMIKAMRHWVETNPKGVPGEWEGFEKAVDESTGRNYKWFFDQWVRRAGYPKFDVTDPSYSDGVLSLDVKFDGPAYRLRPEILLVYPDGTDQIVKAIIPAQETSTIRVAARAKPVLVSFDPYRRLARRLSSDETPPSLAGFWRDASVYSSLPTGSVLSRNAQPLSSAPRSLDGTALLGMPEDSALLRGLAAKVGFTFDGDKLTYDGTTIDLNTECAEALVDLGGGQTCLVAFGKPKLTPELGDAALVLTDSLGRPLRAKTLPKTSGKFVFRLQ